MKIPDEYYVCYNGTLAELWCHEAAKVGIENGIYVEVAWDKSVSWDDKRINRIYFKVLDHEFDNLTDLKRAIANKSFL